MRSMAWAPVPLVSPVALHFRSGTLAVAARLARCCALAALPDDTEMTAPAVPHHRQNRHPSQTLMQQVPVLQRPLRYRATSCQLKPPSSSATRNRDYWAAARH